MIRFIFICFSCMFIAACGKTASTLSDFVDASEYEDNPYIISTTRVGNIERGTNIHQLYALYPREQIKISKSYSGIFNEEIDDYDIYNANGKLILTVSPKIKGDTSSYINRIVIRDSIYKTAKGIGINSTLGDIRKSYLGARFNASGGDLLVTVSDISSSFLFHRRQLEGSWQEEQNNKVIEHNIPDSIRVDAVIVYWKTDEVTQQMPAIFTPDFWHDHLRQLAVWAVKELPSILILLILFMVLLRLNKFIIGKMKKLATLRANRSEGINSYEAQKRINTLTEIISSVIRIFLWVIFLLIILSKININIAPILASAGIVGLAVGFGAQELVRDFISGFFILFEDQLRTGDYAVINGTEGNVEKIELRTITLRDGSGTVHIFQNGKINTLSNKTKEWSAIVLDIGVAYKEDTDRVSKIMKAVGDEMLNDPEFKSDMLEPITISGVNEFADSAVIIRAVIKTKPLSQWSTGREYRRRLKKAFDAQQVEIPFPYRTITWGDSSNPVRIRLEGEHMIPVKENPEKNDTETKNQST